MNKSVTLISTALLAVGLAAGAMAADAPKSVTTTAADAPAAADAPKTTAAPKKHSKKHKKSTGTTAAPASK